MDVCGQGDLIADVVADVMIEGIIARKQVTAVDARYHDIGMRRGKNGIDDCVAELARHRIPVNQLVPRKDKAAILADIVNAVCHRSKEMAQVLILTP